MPMHPFRRLDPTGAHRGDPVDPDVDLHDPAQRSELSMHPWTLVVIGVGGSLGASARHALDLVWPTGVSSVPWATFLTNVTGCLLIGVVMVAVIEAGQRHPLWRPFLGVGVLGGYTTFATYAVQVQQAIDGGEPGLALAYLFGTVAGAFFAVMSGMMAARALLRAMGNHRPPSGDEPVAQASDGADS